MLLAPYCYPQRPSDTVILPQPQEPLVWEVQFVDAEIGDLLIQNPVVFRPAEGQEGHLSVASLVLIAPQYILDPPGFVVILESGAIETRE